LQRCDVDGSRFGETMLGHLGSPCCVGSVLAHPSPSLQPSLASQYQQCSSRIRMRILRAPDRPLRVTRLDARGSRAVDAQRRRAGNRLREGLQFSRGDRQTERPVESRRRNP
jgi:hypothetical protein